MEEGRPAPHLLFVTSPLQGHINPVRRLAARVAAAAPQVRVTFSTTVYGHRRMFPTLSSPDDEAVDGAGMLHAPFSDGFDEGFNHQARDARTYNARVREVGAATLSSVISRLAARGRPVTCVVYTFLVGWAPGVAHAHGLPTALYWIMPAAVFAVYYHYFHGHGEAVAACATGADGAVRLPGLPPLRPDALPSIVAATSPEDRLYTVLQTLRDLFAELDEHRPTVLVNTFDALEPDALRAVPRLDLVAVGPVVPDGASPPDVPLRHGDAAAYVAWLDAKPAGSVVYVSFGTIFPASKRQEEEIRRGLEAAGRPYLWVSTQSGAEEEAGQGMVVEWCEQVRVLSHPAVGCFVTHCGWNSALESVSCGVPVVALPQWTDQPTVAWVVEECAGCGVRAMVDGEGVAERGEIQMCVETLMGDGDSAVEIRARAARWMERAKEAIASGGTSERNIRDFASGL